MKIIAFDPGTIKVGWAVFEIGRSIRLVESGLIHAKQKYPIFARLVLIGAETERLLQIFNLQRGFMEAGFFKTGTNRSSDALAQARGIIGANIFKHTGHSPEFIAISTAKNDMTGNGKAKKEDMVKFVNLRFGLSIKSEDEADAIAIGFSAATKYQQMQRIVDKCNGVAG